MGARVLAYRRKREGRTDYKKRLSLLKSHLPRLVVRGSNKSVQAQLVQYHEDGDIVLATARATDLSKLGWKGNTGNTPAAYLTGILLAKKSNIKDEIIVDIGLQKHHKGGRIYAVAKGAIEGGLKVRISEEALPSDDRINGKHIDEKVTKMVTDVKGKITK